MGIVDKIKKLLFEGSKTIIGYHGTNAKFKQFDQKHARIVNDFYGGGIAYFTSDTGVAITYAKSMVRTKKSGEPYVYKCKITLNKIFDVDHKFTGKELTQFFTKETVDDFARGASLLKLNSDKYVIISKLLSGDMTLTGEEVFKGLSRGMVNTAKTRQKLIELGYDGLRYNGGVNMDMATKHDVYLVYDAKDITIEKIFKVVKKK
jgi:hypothetical protein